MGNPSNGMDTASGLNPMIGDEECDGNLRHIIAPPKAVSTPSNG
jgi:hypothetical protein